ncbi:hypothetical protein B5S31_g2670 [[Candida] boidinii]|nr:hypothetical protein B5S31_g2670 [[Candida] boidinii]OWB78966.1 hypothetical protein B5S32_g3173 [[Candida] boidinii]
MRLYLSIYLIFYYIPYIIGIYIPESNKPVLVSRNLEKHEIRHSSETVNRIGGSEFPSQIYNLIFKGNETNIVESKSSEIETETKTETGTDYKGIILSRYGVNKDEFNILESLNMTYSIVDIFGQKLPIFTKIKEINENSTQIINNDYLFLFKEKFNFKNNLNDFFNYISLKKYLLSDLQIYLPKSLFTNSNNINLWNKLIKNNNNTPPSYYRLIKDIKIDKDDNNANNILNNSSHVSIYLFEKYGKTNSKNQIGINSMKSYDLSGSLDILQENINKQVTDQISFNAYNSESKTNEKLPHFILKLKDTIVKSNSVCKHSIENTHLYMGQLADSKEIKMNHKLHDTITDKTISLGVALDLSTDINNLSETDLIKCCPSSIDEQRDRHRVWRLNELSFYIRGNDTNVVENHGTMELNQEQGEEINSTSIITPFDTEKNTADNNNNVIDLADLSELEEFEAIEMEDYENYFNDKLNLYEYENLIGDENGNGNENRHLKFEIQIATCNGSDKLDIQNS